jgi:hypothetical protein
MRISGKKKNDLDATQVLYKCVLQVGLKYTSKLTGRLPLLY